MTENIIFEWFNAYGISNGRRLRVCFTMRSDNIIRVISMFKVHKKEWNRHYGIEKNNLK